MKIAVDLRPLRPGGENGGAKTLVITLLREFSRLQVDDFEYVLITEDWNFEELRAFESKNISCLLSSDLFLTQKEKLVPPEAKKLIGSNKVVASISALLKRSSLIKSLLLRVKHLIVFLRQHSPKLLVNRLPLVKDVRGSFNHPENHSHPILQDSTRILKDQYQIDLLFCPFSDPILAENGLPLVAIVHDFQHLDLPFFFDERERNHRTRFFQNLLSKANTIICNSEFTRQSFQKHFSCDGKNMLSIPICIHERLVFKPQLLVDKVLKKCSISQKPYLFFPANFWPHKNHRLLLAAYSIYRHNHPNSALDLVFTGALQSSQAEFKDIVACLGYTDNVHFLGFLKEEELTAIWQGCQGLVFPSLYEGFGIPLLEAMWFGKPIACSSTGSLPEVGSDAVIYFDPRKPEAIADAMAKISHDEILVKHLVEKGRNRLKSFRQRSMAEKYLEVFKETALVNW